VKEAASSALTSCPAFHRDLAAWRERESTAAPLCLWPALSEPAALRTFKSSEQLVKSGIVRVFCDDCHGPREEWPCHGALI
jgi:hypothetical protein